MEDCGHDKLTLAGIAILAFVIADLSHEALGHGIVAYFVGAKHIVLSYTYLSTDLQSRSISFAGPLANFIEGVFALLLLRRFRMSASTGYFIFLLMNFNLLDAAAYLVYSGVLNSGDLGVVIVCQPHLGFIRFGMVLAGLALYWALTLAGGRELGRFQLPRTTLTTTAYLAALGLDCGAALLNPLGLKYFLISALPATLGANAGMLAMPRLSERNAVYTPSYNIGRSYAWIVTGLVVAAIFIFLVGPGLTLTRYLGLLKQYSQLYLMDILPTV